MKANDPDLPAEWKVPHASGLIEVSTTPNTYGHVRCPVCESGIELAPEETRGEIERMSTEIRRIRRGYR